jgi:hypothetical protein
MLLFSRARIIQLIVMFENHLMRLIVLVSFIIGSGLAFADQSGTELLGSVNPTIYHVSTGGLWEGKKEYGNWRVIVRNLGWEHTRSFLYLQWLRVDDKTNKIVVHKTIPIPEMNTGNWHNVNNVEYHNKSFIIYYTIRGQEVAQKSTLTPGLPGAYSIN